LRKRQDRSFLHYGIREDDLKVVRELCVKHGVPEDGSWRHERITLSPLNREFEPIVIDENEDGEFAVVAVWKGVV